MAVIVAVLVCRRDAREGWKHARCYCFDHAGGLIPPWRLLSPYTSCRGNTVAHASHQVIAHQLWSSQLDSIPGLRPSTSTLLLIKACQSKPGRLSPRRQVGFECLRKLEPWRSQRAFLMWNCAATAN